VDGMKGYDLPSLGYKFVLLDDCECLVMRFEWLVFRVACDSQVGPPQSEMRTATSSPRRISSRRASPHSGSTYKALEWSWGSTPAQVSDTSSLAL
jgi:hypothetical protein